MPTPKNRRVTSPKKISRRKRTPRCDSCSKRDGDETGEGEEGSKVRLKLCARCRGVAYCGMDCQKAGWKRHREVCVKYPNASELPAPSPLVNHQKVGGTGGRNRRKVFVGAGPVVATPRNRQNAPTRHPFFGNQQDAAAAATRDAGDVSSAPPPAPSIQGTPHRKKKSQGEQQHESVVHPQPQPQQGTQKEDGCPSPPTMQRLSMPGGPVRRSSGSLSRGSSHGSRKSLLVGANTKVSPRNEQQQIGAAAQAAAADAGRKADGRAKTTSPNTRRLSFSPPTSRTRRSTYTPNPVGSRGNISPPPVPPRQAPVVITGRNDGFIPNRRESAPLYPVVLEHNRRLNNAKIAGPSNRGPPPPYESVAHRAESIRKLSPPLSAGTRPAVWSVSALTMASGTPRDVISSAAAAEASARGRAGSADGVVKVEDVVPPPSLRPPSVPPNASFPPPSSAPRSLRPSVVVRANTSPNGGGVPTLASSQGSSSSGELVNFDDSGQSKRSTTERQAGEEEKVDEREGVAGVGMGAEAKLHTSGEGPQKEDAKIGSAVSAREMEEERERLVALGKKGKEEDRGKAEQVARGEAGDAQLEEVTPEEGVQDEAEPEGGLSNEPADEESSTDTQDTFDTFEQYPAEGSAEDPAAVRGSDAAPVRHAMAPPPPILPSSVETRNSTTGDDLMRALSRGVFDSCPSSAGVVGFANRKVSTSPPLRSLSVGTAPHPGREEALSEESNGAATNAATGSGRKSSPRPRPPLSPGPAVLLHKSLARPFSIFRSKLAREALIDEGTSTSDVGRVGTTPSSTKQTTTEAAAAVAAAAWEKIASAAFTSLPTRSSLNKSPPQAPAVIGESARVSSPITPPFVPLIELSPQIKPPTPHTPGPRRTETAMLYQRRLDKPGIGGLPPSSKAYIGRPPGFCVHVLVASALTAADLAVPSREGSPVSDDGNDDQASAGSIPPALKTARWEKAHQSKTRKDRNKSKPWMFYSFDERGRVAGALQPGDVVLLTPGRYEARAWGLQHLVSSVEIIGVGGNAAGCVVYNDPYPSCASSSSFSPNRGEHYLIGVMGVAAGGHDNGGVAPKVNGKDSIDDDSDSGWEDGAFGSAGSVRSSFSGRAVRVRLANLTLEQGSGYRGAVYQLGHESHLELDGCEVHCVQGGVNVDQGTCLICDSKIWGSEVFGVHIGGEGAVEHCSIRDCGRGGGGSKPLSGFSSAGKGGIGTIDERSGIWEYDDGTNVNRVGGMPAVSVLQSSRVRVRFNVIQENAGHSLQCRDAPLPGGDEKYAMLARRAEAEAEEVSRDVVKLVRVHGSHAMCLCVVVSVCACVSVCFGFICLSLALS